MVGRFRGLVYKDKSSGFGWIEQIKMTEYIIIINE